jgi:beta-N-acetylhexosaminidase
MAQFKKTIYFFLFIIPIGILMGIYTKPIIYNHPQPDFISNESDWANNNMLNLTLEEKIAQLFMVATWPEKNEKHQAEIEKLIRDHKIGGLIYFQGDRENTKASIIRMQKASKTPLLIGMDAEWGVAMRLKNEERFPYAYTIGTANDLELTKKIGAMMAEECRDMGIHINFAPVADVNSNPNNPVIGFRSFGENPAQVAKQVASFVEGMEGNGTMTSIKHFPGHGDTDKDSHYELPTVSHSIKQFNATDFKPFVAGIKAGASSVMVGHLNVPAIDNSGTPSSLSKKVIQHYLKDSLGFKGLVISDALNMKAVADKYGKTEVVVKAFEAGCDILLYPESVEESIKAIAAKVRNGEISQKEIDKRCMKVLMAKFHAFFPTKPPQKFSAGDVEWAKKQTYEKALTVIQNENNILPLNGASKKIAIVSIGSNGMPFKEMVNNFTQATSFHFEHAEEAMQKMESKLSNFDVVITSIHATSVRSSAGYGMSECWEEWLEMIPSKTKSVVALFGNPTALANWEEIKKQDALIIAYENHPFAQDRAAQIIFGAIGSTGKMNFQVSPYLHTGKGLELKAINILKYSQPEELGISSKKLTEIDALVENGIKKGAFPGCQVFVAIEGKIIYNKSFGTKTYNNIDTVHNNDVYDIASISKIVGSTAALMRLQTEGKFSLDKKLNDYIPEVTKSTAYADIKLKDMLAHQAGLVSWIPFYKKTIVDGKLNSEIYSTEKKAGFETLVAENVWIKDSYADSIYAQILNAKLGVKKYVYSDLGYYFVKKIVEKESQRSFDQFLYASLYEPMGLRNIRFNPLNYFPYQRIVPSENDMVFRKQIVQGFVHDPGAAMLGGVGGHAGVFANATDLGAMMQLFLNDGNYANHQYIDAKVVHEYTKAQNPGNRRGAGFDRPTVGNGGPSSGLVSQKSFGHSGFTGTLAWADPVYKVNYVFLSNRVYPSSENWKIRDMNIRSEVQRIVYEAIIK